MRLSIYWQIFLFWINYSFEVFLALSLSKAAAAASKGIQDVDSPAVAQNGSAGGKKPSSNTLPELEYREKERGKNESKKQHNHNQNHHSSTSSILPSVDSKAQEMEYMENHVNSKRLSSSDLLGSTENLLKDEHSSSSSSSSSSNSNKNYKNASGGGGSSSPRGHGTANGSVPSSSGPSSSTSSSSKGDRKQKCGGGKNATSHRDPVENCIPNNQLSKPDALVRLDSHTSSVSKLWLRVKTAALVFKRVVWKHYTLASMFCNVFPYTLLSI